VTLIRRGITFLLPARTIPIFRNATFLIINSFAGALLGAGFWLLSARLFESSEVGSASVVLSLVGFVTVVSKLGFDSGIVRFVNEWENRGAVLLSLLLLCGIVAFGTTSAIMLADRLFGIADRLLWHTPFLTPLVVVASVAYSVFLLEEDIFIGLRRIDFMAYQNILFRTLPLSLLPLLSIWSRDYTVIVASWSFAILLGFLVRTFYFIPRTIHPDKLSFSFRMPQAAGFGKYVSANYIASILAVAPSSFMPVIVVSSLGAANGAFFYAAWLVAGLLYAVPNAFAMSLFAEGSSDPRSSDLTLVIRHYWKISSLATALLAMLLFAFSGPVMQLFGKGYQENSMDVLRLLSLSAVPLSFMLTYVTILRIRTEPRGIVILYAVLAFSFISLSMIVVRGCGLVGIAASWLAVSTLIGFLSVVGINKALAEE